MVLTLLADLVVGCMGGLLALRRPARPVLVAAAGLGLVVLGHVLVLQRALVPSVGWSAAGAALLVAGWPLVTAGALGHGAPAAGDVDGDVAAEARLTAVTTTGTVVVLGVGVLGVLLRPPVDQVSLWLVLVLVVVVWIREMIATGQRSSLLRRLHAGGDPRSTHRPGEPAAADAPARHRRSAPDLVPAHPRPGRLQDGQRRARARDG